MGIKSQGKFKLSFFSLPLCLSTPDGETIDPGRIGHYLVQSHHQFLGSPLALAGIHSLGGPCSSPPQSLQEIWTHKRYLYSFSLFLTPSFYIALNSFFPFNYFISLILRTTKPDGKIKGLQYFRKFLRYGPMLRFFYMIESLHSYLSF